MAQQHMRTTAIVFCKLAFVGLGLLQWPFRGLASWCEFRCRLRMSFASPAEQANTDRARALPGEEGQAVAPMEVAADLTPSMALPLDGLEPLPTGIHVHCLPCPSTLPVNLSLLSVSLWGRVL